MAVILYSENCIIAFSRYLNNCLHGYSKSVSQAKTDAQLYPKCMYTIRYNLKEEDSNIPFAGLFCAAT